MQILDEQRRIIPSQPVIEYLHALVLAEDAITGAITDIEPDPQAWGSSGLHFSGRVRSSAAPVLLKLNVPPDQLWWTQQLARAQPDLIPQVFAAGERLAGEALGWVIWERVPEGLHPGWQGREFEMLLEAGVQFQRAARALANAAQDAGVLGELRVEDLGAQLEQGVRRAAPGQAARVLSRLPDDWAWVKSVCETEICHGDLHMANGLSREEPPGGAALLIDFHPTRMPWACEPAKPEILNADPARLGCRGLVVRQAAIRSRYGLSVPPQADLERLQSIVLGWWAIQMWGYIGSEPDPAWRAPEVWYAENEAYIDAAAMA